jgi:hypothetical protein
VDDDPWTHVAGVSNEILLQMKKRAQAKKKAMPSLRDIRAMPRGDATSTLKSLVGDDVDMDLKQVLDSVASLPFISIGKVKLSQQTEKTTGKNTGTLNLDLVICKNRNSSPLTLALVLGTPQHHTLLAHHTIGIGHNGKVTKSVELSFDWTAANAHAGESGGTIILRLLLEEIRGLDAQVALPLRAGSHESTEDSVYY